MAYIAKKVCSFGGVGFLIGDPIPDNLIHPGRVADLIKMGLIEKIPETVQTYTVEDAEIGQVTFCINIHAEEGELPLEVNNDELQQVFDVLQGTVDDAKKALAGIDSENALILLDVTESRKSVKAALKEHLTNKGFTASE